SCPARDPRCLRHPPSGTLHLSVSLSIRGGHRVRISPYAGGGRVGGTRYGFGPGDLRHGGGFGAAARTKPPARHGGAARDGTIAARTRPRSARSGGRRSDDA